MTGESNPPSRRGCLFYGLLTLVVGGLLLLLVAGFGVYLFKRVSQSWVQDYTDTAPASMDRVEYTPAQMEALQARWTTFQDGLAKGRTEELTLSAEDLNALIYDQADLRGRIFVHIAGDRVKGERR